MAVFTIPFGTTPCGKDVHLFVLTNANGMRAELTDLGGCLVSLNVPDAHGGFPDVVLGYDSPAAYTDNAMDIGAPIGRHANFMDNATFVLDGETYVIGKNVGEHNLHSGPDYWFQRLWSASVDEAANAVTFHLDSPDGDQGFPGAVDANYTYQLTEDNRLVLTYDMRPDRRTLINCTHHSFFNLDGHASGTIDDHVLQIEADQFTIATPEHITTGEIVDVAGTVMDFREPRRIGDAFGTSDPLITVYGGYDQNFCLRGSGSRRVATLVAGRSGIAMDVWSDLPAMQCYTANALQDLPGKDGMTYGPHDAVCLEPHFIPDAINKPQWEQPVFGPDKPYKSTTVFAFRTV